MMIWEKKGLIYCPNQKYFWNKSHAQVPIVDILSDKVWRIYYSSRDIKGKSYTSFIDVEAGNPNNILYEHSLPILSLGSIGTFDDSGIMPTSIINFNNKKYLYYIGWTLKSTVPYHNSIGLAISYDNGLTFMKEFEGPIINTTALEPYFSGTCYVIKDSESFKAWYLSCTKWEIINSKPEPFYHIKYAESLDGINWERKGQVAIDYISDKEGGIVSASVIKNKENYEMWYAYRQASNYREDKQSAYHIGYAESLDGKYWLRKDDLVGISKSDNGWDSEMMCYPNVIEHKNKKFMFYNGNGFGKSGFGYAVLNN
jgi:hypothetical protein